MSETSMGPGWWQASDLKWYPPEEQPRSQPPAPPAPAIAPTANYEPAAAPQTVAPGLPAVETIQRNVGSIVKRMSVTAWLITAGAVVAAVSSFFPWAQGTLSDGVGDSYTQTVTMGGVGRFLVVAIAVATVVLSLPLLAGTPFSRSRKIGLTVLVGVFTLLVGLWAASAVSSGKAQGLTNATAGFGTVLCILAVVAIWTGVILAWTAKSKTRAAAV